MCAEMFMFWCNERDHVSSAKCDGRMVNWKGNGSEVVQYIFWFILLNDLRHHIILFLVLYSVNIYFYHPILFPFGCYIFVFFLSFFLCHSLGDNDLVNIFLRFLVTNATFLYLEMS
jgi:hypothetical protein